MKNRWLIILIFTILTGCGFIEKKPVDWYDRATYAGGSAIDYTQNTTPAATDEMLGIDNPSGSWAINRYPIQNIFDLMEADISGFKIHIDNLSSSVLYSGGDAGTPSAIDLTNGTALPTITISDNESTDEENPIVFVAGADPDGGELGLETNENATINPSTGTITATAFVGDGSSLTGVAASNAITQGNSSSTITDAGTGSWTLSIDGTTVASATASGLSIGPININYAVNGTTLHSGIVGGTGLVSGEDIDRGEIVILATDGAVDLYDANGGTTQKPDGICIANNTSGNAIYYLTYGTIYQAAHGLTVGHSLCASETGGAYEDCSTTASAWDTDGDVGVVIGKVVSSSVLFFDFAGEPNIHD